MMRRTTLHGPLVIALTLTCLLTQTPQARAEQGDDASTTLTLQLVQTDPAPEMLAEQASEHAGTSDRALPKTDDGFPRECVPLCICLATAATFVAFGAGRQRGDDGDAA